MASSTLTCGRRRVSLSPINCDLIDYARSTAPRDSKRARLIVMTRARELHLPAFFALADLSICALRGAGYHRYRYRRRASGREGGSLSLVRLYRVVNCACARARRFHRTDPGKFRVYRTRGGNRAADYPTPRVPAARAIRR